MASRSGRTIINPSGLKSVDAIKPDIVKPSTQVYNDTILVRSKIDARYKTYGSKTGQLYVFNGAGSMLPVDKRDVKTLLMKNQGGKPCCGGGVTTDTKMFELV